MTFSACKKTGGSVFKTYNARTSVQISSISVAKVPYTTSTVSLGCFASAGGLILSIPGNPGAPVGWILRGATVLLGLVGVATSCPN
jgi:hypothetical protein